MGNNGLSSSPFEPVSKLPAWVLNHPDNPPAIANPMDDEFDAPTINNKWSTFEAAGLVYTKEQTNSWLAVHGTLQKNYGLFFYQPIAGASWKFRAKIAFEGPIWNFAAVGMGAGNSSSGKWSACSVISHSSYGVLSYYAARLTNMSLTTEYDLYNSVSQISYMQVELIGNNLVFSASTSGNIWRQIWSESVSGFTGTIDRIGLWAMPYANDTQAFTLSFDWFRRIS